MKRVLSVILCIISLMLLLNILSFGLFDEYVTEPLSEEEKTEIWDNIDLSVCDASDISEYTQTILSFDVSKNEDLLLGLSGNKLLLINKDGEAVKEMNFDLDSYYYVSWENENILLYISRGMLLAKLTADGEFIDMISVKTRDCLENDELWRRETQKNAVTVNGNKYEMKNDMGIMNFVASSYSQIVKTDENGTETLLYDVNAEHIRGIIIIVILFLLLISLFALFAVYQYKRIYKNHKKATKNIINYDALMHNFCYRTNKSKSEITALLNTRNINDKLDYEFDETTSTITFKPNKIDFTFEVSYSVSIMELCETTLVKITQKNHTLTSKNLPFFQNDFWTAKIGAEPAVYF